MRKLYIFLFVVAALLVGLLQNAMSDDKDYAVYGVTQRCDSENGCPGEIVGYASVQLKYYDGDSWEDAGTTTSSATGNYGYLAIPNSTQCMIRAWKDSWSVGWYYFTTPAEGSIEFNLMTDMEINQCGCN